MKVAPAKYFLGRLFTNVILKFNATSLITFFLSLHHSAFDYSGGYYNPVLATGLKYGCKGHSTLELVLVYWVGASLGAIASVYLYPVLKNGGIKSVGLTEDAGKIKEN